MCSMSAGAIRGWWHRHVFSKADPDVLNSQGMRSPRLICEHLPDDRIDVDKWRILPESQSYRLQGRREIRHFSTLMPTAHDIPQNITAVAAFS